MTDAQMLASLLARKKQIDHRTTAHQRWLMEAVELLLRIELARQGNAPIDKA